MPSNSALDGVANAAAQALSGRIVPGELVSLYGRGLGNQVFVDELPAPILYSSLEQINAIVPFGIDGRELVTVRSGDAKAVLGVASAAPEIFKNGDGFAAALNEERHGEFDNQPCQSRFHYYRMGYRGSGLAIRDRRRLDESRVSARTSGHRSNHWVPSDANAVRGCSTGDGRRRVSDERSGSRYDFRR
jgi:hypothetical protein